MKHRLGLLVALLTIAAPAFAQTITIDYDRDYSFEKVKTFSYVETHDTNAQDQLMDGRIHEGIVRELTADGLKQVDSEPDLFVTYHLSSQQNMVLSTTGYGYGGWGGSARRWGGGISTATTTSSTYTRGTLIIDAYEPVDKKMVWRGTGTVTLKSKPEKRTQQIDNILSKMGKRWKKILAKQGE